MDERGDALRRAGVEKAAREPGALHRRARTRLRRAAPVPAGRASGVARATDFRGECKASGMAIELAASSLPHASSAPCDPSRQRARPAFGQKDGFLLGFKVIPVASSGGFMATTTFGPVRLVGSLLQRMRRWLLAGVVAGAAVSGAPGGRADRGADRLARSRRFPRRRRSRWCPRNDRSPVRIDPVEEEYRIGTQDLLEVQVLGMQDLRREARVNAKGMIGLPLIGAVRVAGLTVRGGRSADRRALQQELSAESRGVGVRQGVHAAERDDRRRRRQARNLPAEGADDVAAGARERGRPGLAHGSERRRAVPDGRQRAAGDQVRRHQDPRRGSPGSAAAARRPDRRESLRRRASPSGIRCSATSSASSTRSTTCRGRRPRDARRRSQLRSAGLAAQRRRPPRSSSVATPSCRRCCFPPRSPRRPRTTRSTFATCGTSSSSGSGRSSRSS